MENINVKELNLWEKISLISEGTGAISKDSSVGSKGYGYKAVSIENVVKNVGAQMHKYGVVIYPINQNVNFYNEDIVTSKGEPGKNRVVEAEITYEVVNIHKPEEKIQVVGFASSIDPVDKHSGKCQTYAYKNMLIKLFNLPVGDDLDKEHSDDYNKKNGIAGYTGSTKTISDKQVWFLKNEASKANITERSLIATIKKDFGLQKVEELTTPQMNTLLEKIKNKRA